jgi:hypothetical protein
MCLHKLRNQLAHSYSAEKPGAVRDDAVYHRRTYWHGREKDLDIDAEEVFTLAEAVEKILSEDLAEIARRSLPPSGTASNRRVELARRACKLPILARTCDNPSACQEGQRTVPRGLAFG